MKNDEQGELKQKKEKSRGRMKYGRKGMVEAEEDWEAGGTKEEEGRLNYGEKEESQEENIVRQEKKFHSEILTS